LWISFINPFMHGAFFASPSILDEHTCGRRTLGGQIGKNRISATAQNFSKHSLMRLFSANGLQPSQGDGWKLVGQLPDGLETQFVEVAKEKAQSRATYDDAVASLCGGHPHCSVAFFLTGDLIPRDQPSRLFFGSGGYSNFPILAFYANNDFTTWDCVRAGITGAPLHALCGEGVKESYRAILSIAGRSGMAAACHWPPDDGKAVVAKFLASLKDAKRREQFRQAFDKHHGAVHDGPDDPADCRRLRRRIDDDARHARKVLESVSSSGTI
jgi:hypothetical protein